jgi:demethylmenaquinone methyltransferase/2-methoxy-6-polyprenyl-1,4-benzoquinol methylase
MAEAMPFEDASFDAAIVMDAIHHFRDQPGAVLELRRVVRPGGGVLIYDYDPRHWIMRIIAFFERAAGEPCAFFTPDGLCAFMTRQGIAGECRPEGGASYRFIGQVLPQDEPPREPGR